MNEVNDAIYDALYANANLAAAVGARIYRGIAPYEATYPLVTFQKVGGGDLTETPADSAELLYLVQGASQRSAAEAERLAGYIHTALHKATLAVSGWTNIWTAVANHMQAVEMDVQSGKVSWQAGRFVRIRLSR